MLTQTHLKIAQAIKADVEAMKEAQMTTDGSQTHEAYSRAMATGYAALSQAKYLVAHSHSLVSADDRKAFLVACGLPHHVEELK